MEEVVEGYFDCSSGGIQPHPPLFQQPGFWHPTAPRHEWSVVLFRRTLQISPQQPLRFVISASHRYTLWVNGHLHAKGPSRSDPSRWFFREMECAPTPDGQFLLAVEVVYTGEAAGESQIGPPAFLLLSQVEGGNYTQTSIVDWRCWQDTSVQPRRDCKRWGVLDQAEYSRAKDHPWGWNEPGFSGETEWVSPVQVGTGGDSWGNLSLECSFLPEIIPPMKLVKQSWIRLADKTARFTGCGWPRESSPLSIPSNSKARFVLDAGAPGLFWPEIRMGGGRGATVRATWSEAPRLADGSKHDRDQVFLSRLTGPCDIFHPDGGIDRCFRTRWLRSFRYLILEIQTVDDPLQLSLPELTETGFPFARRLQLQADDHWARLLAVSERTLLNCAHEMIWDCPHYEQCQFPGDARIQATAHFLMFADDRLVRKALLDMAASQQPEGLLLCRWPSRHVQRIDTYTLQWILMLDDYRMWSGEKDVVESLLPTARKAMAWFLSHLGPHGLSGPGMMAPFIDWSPEFVCGNAPRGITGESGILSLLLIQACQAMERLEKFCGWKGSASTWRNSASVLMQSVKAHCQPGGSDAPVSDIPKSEHLSLHAQVEAVHAGVLHSVTARRILRATMLHPSAAKPGTRYYNWFVGSALEKCGADELALKMVDSWTQQLDDNPGLKTWPENDSSPRSDCHGWGVYPVWAAVALLLGIRPVRSSSGVERLIFDPARHQLEQVEGSIFIPRGEVKVSIQRKKGRAISSRILSPVPFVHKGQEYPEGEYTFENR